MNVLIGGGGGGGCYCIATRISIAIYPSYLAAHFLLFSLSLSCSCSVDATGPADPRSAYRPTEREQHEVWVIGQGLGTPSAALIAPYERHRRQTELVVLEVVAPPYQPLLVEPRVRACPQGDDYLTHGEFCRSALTCFVALLLLRDAWWKSVRVRIGGACMCGCAI